jgi:hypothetical protein
MNFQETAFIVALAATNIAGGLIFGAFLAAKFARLTDKRNHFFRYFAMMLGLYFLECIAFAFGMCTQVFTISISLVWGVLLSLWLRNIAPAGKIIKTCLYIALYGCLPTVSFAVLLLIIWVIAGNGFLNVEQAYNFGIPNFVPWPFNTMLGFCVALAAGTIILKASFTTGIASLITRKNDSAK